MRKLTGESAKDRDYRLALGVLMRSGAIPPEELADQVGLYLRRQSLADIIALFTLYNLQLDVPGSILELGVHRGRHLAILCSIRDMLEPFNARRRILGFDTFTGFSELTLSKNDSGALDDNIFNVGTAYLEHILSLIELHDSSSVLGHLRRLEVIKGDVAETLPNYLSERPETVVSLAYFDLDLYDSTLAALRALRGVLTKGSVLAFDDVNHPKWPGETRALADALGLDTITLKKVAPYSNVVYMRWNPV